MAATASSSVVPSARTPENTVQTVIGPTPSKFNGMASLLYFNNTRQTISDKDDAHVEDMTALFADSWPNLPLRNFYRGLYDDDSNTVDEAKRVLEHIVNDIVDTFTAVDKMTKEDDIYAPCVHEVNRILWLRDGTYPAGVGKLWCYDVHKDPFAPTRSLLKPDIVLMPRVPLAGDDNTASPPVPLAESTNAASTSSSPVLPDSAPYRTRRSMRLASAENVPPSSHIPSPMPDISVEDVKAQPGGLHWGKVIVAMEVKPAVTPDKEAPGFSRTDSDRSKIVKLGVEHAPPVVSKRSVSVARRSHPSQQPQAQPGSSRSTALKRHVANNSVVSAPKRRRTNHSSPESPSATAEISQPTSDTVGFTVPATPEKIQAVRKKGKSSTSKSQASVSKGGGSKRGGSASNGLTLPMPAPFHVPPAASIQKPIASEPEEKSPKPTSDDLQLGRYLTEMMSTTGNRTHAFGCILRGNLFQITYVDPNGIAISERCSLSEPRAAMDFALFFYGLAGCHPSALGLDSRFSVPSDYSGQKAGLLPLDAEGLKYRVKETQVTIKGTINLEYSLCGRRTRVFEVEFPEGDTIRSGVLKLGYPYASRPRESNLMSKAKEVLELNMGHSRGIPILYKEDSGALVSEGFRRHFLKQCTTPLTWPEDRRLEILLMEKLYPLRSFPAPLHIQGMRQIVGTICALGESKFFHRDVSSSNCMVRLHSEEQDHQYFEGVLADFDLAVDQTAGYRLNSKQQHWTGTLPFLSLSIFHFPGSRHITRFDLESAFYVTIWDMCLWPDGNIGRVEDPDATQIFDHWRRVKTSMNAKALLGMAHNGLLTLTKLNPYIKDSADILHDKFAWPVTVLGQGKNIRPDTDRWEDMDGLFNPQIARDTYAALEECLSTHISKLKTKLVPYPWPKYPVPAPDSTVSV